MKYKLYGKTVVCAALIFLMLWVAVACGAEEKPSGIWQTQDGMLSIDFTALRGTWTGEDGTEKEIDVLYSYTLGNIAFYVDEKQEFLGRFEWKYDVIVISDSEGKECYRLTPLEQTDPQES